MRPAGAASVEARRGRGGVIRYRVRSPRLADGSRPIVGIFDTPEEAETRADATADVLAECDLAPVGGLTLACWGEKWLDRRELSREIRDVAGQRRNFKKHIASTPLGLRPMAALSARDVRDWLTTLAKKKVDGTRDTLARATVSRNFALLKVMLRDATEEEIIRENPARHVKLRGREERTEEPWTFLSLDEQRAIASCESIPEADRLIMAFAWYTGLRASELAALRIVDLQVKDARVVVRYSTKDRATKSGKIRRVPLVPAALDVAERWLALLPSYAEENPSKLAFPTQRGARRQPGKMLGLDRQVKDGKQTEKKLDRFGVYLAAAGIKRHVRWHDLRHTCGSSLVSGAWGRRWSIEEVREVLGHASIMMTTRYAHVGESALNVAARETVAASVTPSKVSPTTATRTAKPSPKGAAAVCALVPSWSRVGEGLTPKHLVLLSGSTGTRTPDLRIKSPQLYRLSYRPMCRRTTRRVP